MTACGKIAPPQADVRPQPQETRTNAPTKPQQSGERQRRKEIEAKIETVKRAAGIIIFFFFSVRSFKP
jgi:hypothetical protein